MKRKLKYAGIRAKKMLFMMLDQFSDPFYQGVAAQIAFSLFLSIVPIFILMSQLLGLFSLPLSEVSKWINENVTMEGADALLSLLEYSPSGANNLFLAVIALWSSSRAQFAIRELPTILLRTAKF